MTRDELREKLIALGRAGDAAAVATLGWLHELKHEVRRLTGLLDALEAGRTPAAAATPPENQGGTSVAFDEAADRHGKGLIDKNPLHQAVAKAGMVLDEAERVAAAATRRANGLPEVMDEGVVSGHGGSAGRVTERVPNGGTGEG